MATGLFDVRRNDAGAWCVFYGDVVVSDHATRDAAVAAYNRHLRAAAERVVA